MDLCVITKDNVEYLRNYEIANVRPAKRIYNFPHGTTPIWRDLTTRVVVEEGGDVAMQL